jgi:Protein of unknown function (DUF2911)
MKMKAHLAGAATVLGLSTAAFAQAPMSSPAAPASPAARQRPPRMARETISTTVNGKKVSIEYGRPRLGNRTVKDLLSQLGPDRIWRAGGDQATTLTTETDLMIGGKRIPAGKYTLYLYAPETGDYALIVNSDLGVPLKVIYPAAPPEVADALWPHLEGYDKIAAKEVARIPLKRLTTAVEPTDQFRFALEPPKADVSALTLSWGDQGWTVDVRPSVMP